MIVGVIVGGSFVMLADRGPGMTILAQDDAGQVALHDGRISVFTRINQFRRCRTETTHWLFTLIDHAGEQVRSYVPIAEDGPVPIRNLGVTSYILSVPLPPGLWPGAWYFLESRAEYCGPLGWLFPDLSESPPLLINIERVRAVPDVPVTAVHEDGGTTIRSRSPLLPLNGRQ